MRKAKVYLSAPMTGVLDFNAPLFRHWKEVFCRRGLLVHSPYDMSRLMAIQMRKRMEDLTHRDVLPKEMQLIARRTDAVLILCADFWLSKGVHAEKAMSEACGVPVWTHIWRMSDGARDDRQYWGYWGRDGDGLWTDEMVEWIKSRDCHGSEHEAQG